MGIKVFSLDEANQLLPVIQEAVRRLQAAVAEIVRTQDALSVLEMLGASEPSSPEYREFTERQQELEERVQAFNDQLEDLQNQGCVIKDLNSGVVDFYGEKEGRLVFLCWRLGEPSIRYWHEIDTGMAGRRPVSEL